jgi:DNA primase
VNDRGRIRAEDLDLLRERISIVEVAGDHLQLRRVGRRYVARCPFHDEKTASFSIEPAKNLFHCFGCHEGGDVFTLVQRLEGLDFFEAAEKLAARFGVQLRYEEVSPQRREELARKRRMQEAMAAAAAFFHDQLKNAPDASEARRYLLEERGFGRDTLEMFEVGFAPAARTALLTHLRAQGFKDDVLVACNLAIQTEESGVVDRFRGRITFPIRDRSGGVIGFGARRLGETDGPKYLNTSETPLYRKSEVLYGLDRAARSIVRDDAAILVEGYTDVIALHAAGIDTAVASCGTAVGAEHLKVLKSLGHQLIVCLDADDAGGAAAEAVFTKLGGEAERHGLELRAVVMPPGSDPADVASRGAEGFRALLDHAIPLVELVLVREAGRYKTGDPQARARALQAGLQHLAKVSDPVVVRAAARTFADRIGVDPAVLFVELDRVRGGGGASTGSAETVLKRASAQARREQQLLKLAAQQPELLEPHADAISVESFTVPEHARTWEALRAGTDPARVEDVELRRSLTAVHVGALEGTWDETAAARLVAAFRDSELSRRVETLRAELERAQDDGLARDLMLELQRLDSERRTIRGELD